MNKEIKVKVTFTPGYEQRFTAACLEVIKKREESKKASITCRKQDLSAC